MKSLIEILSGIFLIGGGFFALIASLGLIRFRDLPSRMHAATKASGAAFALVLIAICLRNPGIETIIKSIAALGFAFLTLPVAAHLLGRNALSEQRAAEKEQRQSESAD
jgi:multicomponent Na+:H+ antiporter subunit G